MKSSCCICNNTNLAKSITCLKCKRSSIEHLSRNERIASCPNPEHNSCVVIPEIIPTLCFYCTFKGYFIEKQDIEYVIKKIDE